MADYKRKDHLYEQAKAQGVRSRAFYKLKELDQKFKLLHPGDWVLDLGAWPGGWLEYSRKKVGPRGFCLGVDLKPIDEFKSKSVAVFEADICDPDSIEQAEALCQARILEHEHELGFELLLSDLSPQLSGIPDVDRAASCGLGEKAMYWAERLLLPGGNVVIKLFKSSESDQFVKNLRASFNKVQRNELRSTRKSSQEFYFVGLGYKKTIE